MFEILKNLIENQGAKVIVESDGFNVIVSEDNEITIRDILAVNDINWCFDFGDGRDMIWVDWDNLPF